MSTTNHVATPGSQPSPASVQQQLPQLSVAHHQRKDVAVVFIVDGSARMRPHLNLLYEAYVEPILKQLRSPIITEADERQAKTKIVPVLRCGLVVFGDYEPLSEITVDRKYFTPDLILFQDIFKSIECKYGGPVKNAVEEGMVAALELFNDYKQETEGREPVQHCILLSNSLPSKLGARCNLDVKYDGLKMDGIAEEMKKSNIRFSLICPKRGYTDLEQMVHKINGDAIEINTITETAESSHLVQLAGFTLPVALTTQQQQKQPSTPVNSATVDTKDSPRPMAGSPQSVASEVGKKRKRENIPGQITLPKTSFDASKFTEATARTNSHIAKKQSTVAKKEVPVKIEEDKGNSPSMHAEQPVVAGAKPIQAIPVVQQQTPSPQLQQQQSPQQPQVQQQNQAQTLPQQTAQFQQQPQPVQQSPQPQQQAFQQQQPQQPQQQQPQQPQQPQMQQPIPQPQPGAQPQAQQRPMAASQTSLPQPLANRVQNPILLQQYLLQQRNNLLELGPNLTPVQQNQLQTIQTALVKLTEQLRRTQAAARNGPGMPPGNMNANAATTAATASPTPNSSSPSFVGGNVGSNVRPMMDVNAASMLQAQQQPQQPQPTSQQQQPSPSPSQQPQQPQLKLGGINGPHIPNNLTAQTRMLLAAQLAQRAQNPQGISAANLSELQAQLLQQQQNQQNPQGQQPQPQPQPQQQQPQQQTPLQAQSLPNQQENGTAPTQPIWTGQIVWHIKTQENQLQEYNCHCGAFAIPTKGNNVAIEEYHPEMWPNRIQIAGRSPLARAHILQRQAIENKLPICQFRPLTTSSQQDQNNFTLLVKNLEQKKYIATIIFNLGSGQSLNMASEQHHGVVLTYTTGKLIGVVFTKVPLPDLNAGLPTNNIPNGVFMPNNMAHTSPVPGTNITPAMLANLQNTANLGLLNTANPNVQHLQNALRQQQMMGGAAGMVNAMSGAQQPHQQTAAQGPMNGLNPSSLLLSNLNLANAADGNNILGLNGINMANLGSLPPNAVRDLQQRLLLARQQQQQNQQNQQQQNQQPQPPQQAQP